MSSSAPDAAALGWAVQAVRTEKRISEMQLAEATGFMLIDAGWPWSVGEMVPTYGGVMPRQ